jgi:GxxExxY protein
MLARPSVLVERTLGAAIEVHRAIGPGLLEPAYDECTAHELAARGIAFRRQVPVPLIYGGVEMLCACRADFIVEDEILLELKSVERLLPIHQAQVLTYLKLLNLPQGIILNFNTRRLRDGIKNVLLSSPPSAGEEKP